MRAFRLDVSVPSAASNAAAFMKRPLQLIWCRRQRWSIKIPVGYSSTSSSHAHTHRGDEQTGSKYHVPVDPQLLWVLRVAESRGPCYVTLSLPFLDSREACSRDLSF